MSSESIATSGGTNALLAEDEALLPAVAAVVTSAGARLLDRFTSTSRFTTRDEVVAAIYANDEASLAALRPALEKVRPGARWAEDELDSGALPDGEWWVTDPVEGNINHIHGMTDWGVTATLVRENVPVLAVVLLPTTGDLYTAVLGGGAFLNGEAIHVSAKTDLDAAIVGTGQASPREEADTFRLIGASTTAMVTAGLVVRVSVPATLQLIQVAAGRMDVFWQFSAVRSGLLAGALLVSEAGGSLTDTHGSPWTLDSDSFLAAAPTLVAQSVDILAPLA
jgi:myo-inositol-1(or 4)-monophosphatase